MIELVPVARAFSHFLNLSNVAEQFSSVSKEEQAAPNASEPFPELLKILKSRGLSSQQIADSLSGLSLEVVLTAHPTEVSRRTHILKYEQVFQCLESLEDKGLNSDEKKAVENRIRQLISQAWHTLEFRTQRPTPVDEAKGGLSTLEQSLWQAVPMFIAKLSINGCRKKPGKELPVDIVPVRFSSWMGGDRDGNPHGTAQITREVLLLGRWLAADLYLRDLKPLIGELSMGDCNPRVHQLVGNGCREPYRAILKQLREHLRQTRQWCEHALIDEQNAAHILRDDEELLKPLQLCYDSLNDCGLGVIADGPLRDMLHRVHCFGLTLVRLDIRQEAGRHTEGPE